LPKGSPARLPGSKQHRRVANSDDDPLDDRIVTAWRRLVDDAEAELAPFDPPVERDAGAV